MRRPLERLLPRRQEANGGCGTQRIRRRFRHDQVCYVHGVERAPEQCVHAAQDGVEGVDVALESAAAGQLRLSPVALG